MQTATLPIALYLNLSYGNLDMAVVAGLLLMVTSFVGILAIDTEPRERTVWKGASTVSNKIFAELRSRLASLVADLQLAGDRIVVSAEPLTADEAIGNPEHDDYPLLVGRERMMESVVRGAPGQAFTDMYGRYEGLVGDVLALELTNNFRRAVFVATLNATLRHMGQLTDTRHCRDQGPVECAAGLRTHIDAEGLRPPFALIGFQPRFAEVLSSVGELRICDMDEQHIDQRRFGALVRPPAATDEVLDGCGTAFVTGTTLVNDTIDRFLDLPMPTWFYGVTIAGAAHLLGLNRYCARGL